MKTQKDQIINYNLSRVSDLEVQNQNLKEILELIFEQKFESALEGYAKIKKKKKIKLIDPKRLSSKESKQLIKSIYDQIKQNKHLISKIKVFLKKVQSAQWQPVQKIKQKAQTIEVSEFKGFRHFFKLGSVYVGKNSLGNQEVYSKTHKEPRVWLHACVRGGSLVSILDSKDFALGAVFALIHSKTLKLTNLTSGEVAFTSKIQKTNVQGSFIFDQKSVHVCDTKDLDLFLYQADTLFLTFKTPIQTNAKLLAKFKLAPLSTSGARFNSIEKVLAQNNIKVKNYDVLNRIIPYNWNIV